MPVRDLEHCEKTMLEEENDGLDEQTLSGIDGLLWLPRAYSTISRA